MNDRNEQIIIRFDAHFQGELGVLSIALTPPDWFREAPTAYIPFGWAPPFEDHATELFQFIYCPEVIDGTTGELLDHELVEYLQAIIMLSDVVIINRDLPADERVALAEKAMLVVAPESVKMLSRVQMKALDA